MNERKYLLYKHTKWQKGVPLSFVLLPWYAEPNIMVSSIGKKERAKLAFWINYRYSLCAKSCVTLLIWKLRTYFELVLLFKKKLLWLTFASQHWGIKFEIFFFFAKKNVAHDSRFQIPIHYSFNLYFENDFFSKKMRIKSLTNLNSFTIFHWDQNRCCLGWSSFGHGQDCFLSFFHFFHLLAVINFSANCFFFFFFFFFFTCSLFSLLLSSFYPQPRKIINGMLLST